MAKNYVFCGFSVRQISTYPEEPRWKFESNSNENGDFNYKTNTNDELNNFLYETISWYLHHP
jgi:hypothetical protein